MILMSKNQKKLFLCLLITPMMFSFAYATISEDIDGNGLLNLKDCLQIMHKIANPSEDISINLIKAKQLIRGTYSQVSNSKKTTYVFNEDGTCVRSGPDDFGGILTTEGSWHYENDSLHINTSGEVVVFIARYVVNIDEFYEAAFTNTDGSKLIMAAPGKPMENMPDILGRYSGGGHVDVTLPEFSYGNKMITIESIIDVGFDGSLESVITITTNDQPEINQFQGAADPLMPTIYTFGSSFYPDLFSSDIEAAYFTRE